MITGNRWKHILGVARTAKLLALKFRPDDEKYAQDMFLLGMLHDFGYEFSPDGKNHAAVGGGILRRSGYEYWEEVALHGKETAGRMSDELFILNCADMTTSPDGERMTMTERVEEIAGRYGINSAAHKKSIAQAEKLRSDARYAKIK